MLTLSQILFWQHDKKILIKVKAIFLSIIDYSIQLKCKIPQLYFLFSFLLYIQFRCLIKANSLKPVLIKIN